MLIQKKVVKICINEIKFCEYYTGLVGGDCIAVDPYYIIHSAKKLKYKFAFS